VTVAAPKLAPPTATAALSDRDTAVLDALASAGADLTQPRHVLYFLYFENGDDAAAAAADAKHAGFFAEVSEPLPEYPDQWSLICEKHGLVLTAETVRSNAELFEALASTHQGEFDGWEASA